MMSNNSIQPEWRSNYRGDYKGHVKPISTSDLVAWSFQVARGMEYLASRKVFIHSIIELKQFTYMFFPGSSWGSGGEKHSFDRQ